VLTQTMYHVRNRVYDAENGRWTRRDPLGYVDGMGLYEYCRSWAVEARDPYGLFAISCVGCAVCFGAHFAVCYGMCCCGQYWDTPGESTWSCMGKCLLASVRVPEFMIPCVVTCATCGIRLVQPAARASGASSSTGSRFYDSAGHRGYFEVKQALPSMLKVAICSAQALSIYSLCMNNGGNPVFCQKFAQNMYLLCLARK